MTDSGFHGDSAQPHIPAARRPVWSSVVARCAGLAAAVLVAYPLVAYVVATRFGPQAWRAAALAGAVCWLGAAIALSLTAYMRGPLGAMYGMLFGMLFRMGLPLAVGIVLTKLQAPLAGGGLMACLLAFYFVTLVIETVLVLPLVGAGGAQAKAL